MNPISAGCGDSVEDGKGNPDGSTNTAGGWFWISDPASATNKKKMRTSQSTSSLQLFTIKSTKTTSGKSDKGAAENPCNDHCDDHDRLTEPVVDVDRSVVHGGVVIRRSASLIDVTSADRDGMLGEEDDTEKNTPTEKGGVGEGKDLDSRLKGFGDVGVIVDKDAEDHNTSSMDSIEDENRPEVEGIRKNAEIRPGEIGGENTKRIDDLKKLQELEEKYTKSQATMMILHKTNIKYQDEIVKLKTTLEDESETRRALHEELEASRKLCCEMYENLLQERTRRRSTEISEVERHLSPKALNFSLSDAAAQTDADFVNFCNRKSHQILPHAFKTSGNVSTSILSTKDSTCISSSRDAEIPRYGFHLSHLLEEYQENQKNLEVQLKYLSEQCRAKDKDLKNVREKMGGHIRLSTLLQSEKVCLEETIEQLREEIKSCDHLLQSCDSVLKEKEREIRELKVAKYALEHRVAEFEFKEKELMRLVPDLEEDIRILVSQRKNLCKCVKRSSKSQSRRQQVKVHEPTKKTDNKEIELQAKVELLNAIREIAFNRSPSPTKPTPQLQVDKADTGKPFKHRPKKYQKDEGEKRYTACSVRESVRVTREIVKKASTSSVSLEFVSADKDLDSESKDEGFQCAEPARGKRDEVHNRNYGKQNGSTYTDQKEHDHLTKGNAREQTRGKSEIRQFQNKSYFQESLNERRGVDLDDIQRHLQEGKAFFDDLDKDDEEEKEGVTTSCQNIYSDVINELNCRNAAAGVAAKATGTTYSKDAAVDPCTGSDCKDSCLEDAFSEDSDSQLHLQPVGSMSSVDSFQEFLDPCDSDQKYGHEARHVANKTTHTRKMIAFLDDSKDDDDDDISNDDEDDNYDLRFISKQKNLSSNNSNDSNYDQGCNMKIVEPPNQCHESTVKGTTQDGADGSTDLALQNKTTNNRLSSESLQSVEEVKERDNNMSRLHGIYSYQHGDDLQDDDLEFCVADEEYDVTEQEKKWQDPQDGSGDTTSDFFVEYSTCPMEETGQEDSSIQQERVLENTGGQQETCQRGQDRRRFTGWGQSRSPCKMQKDGSNRHMQRNSLNTVDTGRQADYRFNSGREILESTVTNSHWKAREDRTGPFHVRHSPTDSYSSSEDSDDFHSRNAMLSLHENDNEDCEWQEGACERYGDASPAEGLILRKQVMENYATRANDRAWHYVYMSQDGPALMFYKDRLGKELGAHIDEPLTLTNAIISVAKDYIKRKHVFRVQLPNGHQDMFAARDDREMMFWVCRLDAAAAAATAAAAPPTGHHGSGCSRLPAAIATIPPPTNGSPTRSERLKNFIKGSISALRK